MKLKTIALLWVGATVANATVVTVNNTIGPTTSRETVRADGSLVAGFGAVGTLSEAGIQGLATTFDGLSFVQWGAAGGAVSTSTSSQFSFSGNVNPTDPSVFSGDNVYLVIGFGGTNLATSTELFIYRFTTTFGTADSGTPISLTLGNGDIGTTLLGTEVNNPETSGSTTSRFRAAAISPVPEPSAALLGMLGALGLLRRRR